MTRQWVLGLLSIIVAINGTAFTRNNSAAPGAAIQTANPPPGPDRFTMVTVDYQAYEWQLAAWKEQQPLCTLIIDHEGVPFPGEVYRDCGETIYNTWIVQDPCITKNKAYLRRLLYLCNR